jgi:hypothetical protein
MVLKILENDLRSKGILQVHTSLIYFEIDWTWATLDYLGNGLPWEVGYLRLPWPTLGCLGQPWASLCYLGLPWATLGNLGLPWATLGYLGLPWTTLG